MTDSYTFFRHDVSYFLGEYFYDWRQHLFKELADYLCFQGLDVKIADKESFEVILDRAVKRQVVIRDSLAFIQNDQTKHYYVIDCHDVPKTKDLEIIVRDHRCRRILKCQYRKKTFKEAIYDKVMPWTYFDRFWPAKEAQLVALRKAARTSNTLYFRGATWARRDHVLDELQKKGIMNSDFRIIDFDDYLLESSRHRVLMSLPGMADFCNRDVEAFASGACVLRPKLRNEFHNRLIPDYHYISVDTKYWKTDPVEVADKIEQRFTEIIDDQEYLRWVSRNAAQWYDENVCHDSAMKLTVKLLDLC